MRSYVRAALILVLGLSLGRAQYQPLPVDNDGEVDLDPSVRWFADRSDPALWISRLSFFFTFALVSGAVGAPALHLLQAQLHIPREQCRLLWLCIGFQVQPPEPALLRRTPAVRTRVPPVCLPAHGTLTRVHRPPIAGSHLASASSSAMTEEEGGLRQIVAVLG